MIKRGQASKSIEIMLSNHGVDGESGGWLLNIQPPQSDPGAPVGCHVPHPFEFVEEESTDDNREAQHLHMEYRTTPLYILLERI